MVAVRPQYEQKRAQQTVVGALPQTPEFNALVFQSRKRRRETRTALLRKNSQTARVALQHSPILSHEQKQG